MVARAFFQLTKFNLIDVDCVYIMNLENTSLDDENKKLKESITVDSYSKDDSEPLEEEIKILEVEKKNGTLFQGFFGIVNVIIGGGCLVLPWVSILFEFLWPQFLCPVSFTNNQTFSFYLKSLACSLSF